MVDYTHYDGGRSEEAVVSAINHLLNDDEADTVKKIKNVYWRIGEIIEIAIAERFTETLGLRGWFFLRFGKSETHARDCLKAWQCRRDFDRAYEWYKQGNTDFLPKKLSGPRFCVEVVTAWRDRLKPDAPKSSRRGPTAKQLRAVIAAYRSGFGRLKAEHVRWAEEDQRDSRVLTVIEQEIEEAEAEIATGTDDNGQWPLNTTRDEDIEDDADDTSDGADSKADDEANVTPDDATEDNTDADNAIADTEYTQGEGFVVKDKIVPPKRAARPRGFRRDVAVVEQPKKRGRGRPKGSKNKPKAKAV